MGFKGELDQALTGTTQLDAGAKLTKSQGAAILIERTIGARLAEEHPDEIVAMYRQTKNPLSLLEIAQTFIPETAREHALVASIAVRFALVSLLPKTEREDLFSERFASIALRTMERRTPRQRAVFRRHAAQVRNERAPINTKGIVEGRGRIRWSEQEKELLGMLVSSADYQHHGRGNHLEGKPDHQKIAKLLNEIFHGGEEIRTPNKVAGQLQLPKARARVRRKSQEKFEDRWGTDDSPRE